MGLWHEFQRPDRDTYLTSSCQYLLGYDEALKAALTHEDAAADFPKAPPAAQRVEEM